jgi:NADP-dependent 3-hydroxy acid dehydrogenase YdfG
MLNIQNKVIAITGASSGIGEATARFLAAKGAKVVLGARRIENLQTIAAEIQAVGGEVRFTALDVTQKEQYISCRSLDRPYCHNLLRHQARCAGSIGRTQAGSR